MPQVRRNTRNTGNVYAAGQLKSGTVANPGFAVLSQQVHFDESAGSAAGVYTGSVVLPAGSVLIDIIVSGIALWDAGTSATMKVGDTDDDGYFTGVNVKATDLLAGEEISISGGTGAAGGKAGAYIANSQVNARYSAAARTISGIVTTVGTVGTAGRTLMTVIYAAGKGTDGNGAAIATEATFVAT